MSDSEILGLHRVILEREGAARPLPQQAAKLDSDPSRFYETEILVDVETLNVDAASFRQMEEASAGDVAGVGRLVHQTIVTRGKQHNPVTGSGGMLLGRISRVGELVRHRGFAVGDRIATLASLSLTPLRVSKILAIRPVSAQLDVEGTAVVFASAPLAKLPTDLPERLALAILDVAGAAPQVARLCNPGETVPCLGARALSSSMTCWTRGSPRSMVGMRS